jgi:enoyl-CoA hydratase/carnithine racemase
MLFHCDYVLASTTATFSTPFIHLGLVPEGASSLLMPRTMGHQRAFATLVMGRTVSADDARVAGFVNVVVAPGHTEAEARKVAREICALPAEAVAISRKLLKLPPEDLTRRIDQEGHLFGERMRSKEAVAAFQAFFARRKG